MGCCCCFSSQNAVKIIAILSAIISILVAVASVVRLTSHEPETLNDSLGISAGGLFLLISGILYWGAAETATGRCEIWLAAALTLCGFQIRSISNTIQNWEHTGEIILLVDVVSVVLIIWCIIVVYSFTKEVRKSKITV